MTEVKTKTQQKTKKRLAFKLLALCFSLGLTIIFAEIVLRVLRDPNRYYPHHKNSTAVFYPNVEGPGAIEGTAYFTTNSFGCRGPEIGAEKHRALVIGGSTAACVALDDSESWPHLVMKKVNEKRGQDFLWVTNSGIDGKDSRHHMMHCKYLVPQLPKLDHVIVYCGLNDVGRWLNNKEFDADFRKDESYMENLIGQSFRVSNFVADDLPWYKDLELWKRASIIRNKIRSSELQEQRESGHIAVDDRMEWLKKARNRRNQNAAKRIPQAKEKTFSLARDSYGENLAEIVQLVRKAGAEPIFIAQAIKFDNLTEEQQKLLWMGQMDGGEGFARADDIQKFVDAYNEKMKAVANEHGVPFFDLPAALDGHDLVYYDACHFNEKGAETTAQVVADFLLEQVYKDAN